MIEKFLREEGIENKTLKQSGLSIEILNNIFNDYSKHQSLFQNEANQIKATIENFKGIHSVKVRIKDNFELIRKIIKKSTARSPITLNNYLYKITDIIGARILYLFKSDYEIIHKQILNKFESQFSENVQINVLTGTSKDFDGDIKGFIKRNDFYSSIHYIIKTKDISPETRIELQTRTVFEEGMGEISHFATYKNARSFPILETAVKILARNVELCNDISELIKSLNDEIVAKQISEEKVKQIEEKLVKHFS